MDVSQVIKELLYDYNCVIVPEFGAFIANEVGTRVHPIKKTFLPPSKSIAFNKSLVKNDGLLIKEYALKNKIEDAEAEKIVKSYALQLSQRIEAEKIVRIDEVGTFRLDNEGNIQFKAEDSVNFLNESFGLTELYCKPIENQSMEQQPVAPRRAPIKEEKAKNENVKKEEKSKSKLFLIIPVLLLLLGISSLFLIKNEEGNVYMATLFPALKSGENTTMSNTQEDEQANESEGEFMTSDLRYHVIAGVFKEKVNADRLASKAPSPEILEIDGLYKVSIVSFESLDDAEGSLDNYTAEFGNDIWVLAN